MALHNQGDRVEVFCSYDPNDEPLFRQLEQRLSPLQRAGRLILRHVGQVQPGANVEATLQTWQTQASLILLLVSPAYLASDACYQEATQAMQHSAHVIPVILRPCDWSTMPFAGVQCLPRNRQAITTWTNQDEAWHEVTEGLRQVIDEMSLSDVGAPTQAAGPRIWNVPFARNPFFTGRDKLLEQLHTRQTAAVSQHQVISGLGGIGKTQVAVEYAHRYSTEYQAVLWARAETTEALNASYVEIAGLLNLPQRKAQEQEIIVQAVKGWLGSQGGWLLILDNADEPEMLTSFLPRSVGGQVLVTTRDADLTNLGLGFQHTLVVETFTDDQGVLFLLHRSNQLPLDATLDQAENEVQQRALAIAHELGGLPLALDQAGAYISKTGCSLATYQQIYEKHHTQILKERRSTEHPDSAATTWSLSFEKVEQQNPAAADLLRFCAFLAPDAIPEEILSKGAEALGETLALVAADAFLLNRAIESLRAYSLMSRDATARTLTIHRLVQAVVRDSMLIERQQQWMQRAINAIAAAHPGFDFAHWSAFERLLPHALVCATWIEQTSNTSLTAACLLNQAGVYLHNRARHAEAESLYQRALSIQEQQLGAQHPDTAQSLNNLAFLYVTQGRYAEAEPMYQRALSIYEQQLGVDDPWVAVNLNDLADLYQSQCRYIEAELLYQRALSIDGQVYGPDHPSTARSLNNLARLYRAQGLLTEAEPLCQRALSIQERRLGTDHPGTANSLNNLAGLYQEQSRYIEAELLYQRALAICEQQLGGDHPSTASNLNDLAELYCTLGRHADAEPLYQRALAIYKRSLGPNHPHTRAVHNQYTALLRMTGRDANAETLETEGNR